MNISTFAVGISVLLLLGTIAATVCAKEGQKDNEKPDRHVSEYRNHEEGTGPHHDHAPHNHGEDLHMDHMKEVKSWLKEELGEIYDIPVPPATEEQLSAGKKIYMGSCAPCHGKSGKGDGPVSVSLDSKPSDFTAPAHSRFYSDQGRLYIIKKGVAGTPMAGWDNVLNEKEIQSVYTYVRTLRESVTELTHRH